MGRLHSTSKGKAESLVYSIEVVRGTQTFRMVKAPFVEQGYCDVDAHYWHVFGLIQTLWPRYDYILGLVSGFRSGDCIMT